MNKKVIDDIVWYIPFKKLRNAIREYLLNISNNIENINYIKNNEVDFNNRRLKIRNDLPILLQKKATDETIEFINEYTPNVTVFLY
ncbi:hypothetical protein [Brachyspira hampsonii]|uniref:hypothetical protein n=1 Tax=Brachyspira hampsonii TaxID=1287055 RepID=UPI000D379C52|nr:hypothetical protein [Brachyspira hampsonii]